jgi:peroxiredoxin
MMYFRDIATLTLTAVVAACTPSSGDSTGDTAGTFRPLTVGTAVPAYAAPTLTGDSVHIGGNGPATVLNVWATWCTSCQEEMEALDSLKREFGPRGVRVVAVSVDQGDVEKVRRYAESNHLTMTVAHDPASTINRAFAVVGVPTTFVIGPTGNLVWRHTGNITEVLGEARAAIDTAIAR